MFLSKFVFQRRALAASLLHPSKMGYVVFHGDKFKDKGKGEEEVYFSQQERNVLKKLMKKLETDARQVKEKALASSSDSEGYYDRSKDAQNAAALKAEEQMERLLDIFHTHGVKEDKQLIDDLKHWKSSKK